MSSYTYAILICERQCDCVSELNGILRIYDIAEFDRAGETDIWTMNDNYLNVAKLSEAINSIQWDDPVNIQLFIRSEHDDKYSEIALKPNCALWTEVFETTGEHDSSGTLIGKYRIIQERRPPAAEVAHSIFGTVSESTVRTVVSSRVSEKALADFLKELFKDERSALLSLAENAQHKFGNVIVDIIHEIEKNGKVS